MEAPLREIVTNSGDEPGVVVNNVRGGTGNYGYNEANGEYGDMVAESPPLTLQTKRAHQAPTVWEVSTTFDRLQEDAIHPLFAGCR